MTDYTENSLCDCGKSIDANDYCVCTKCRKKTCPQCAQKNRFVCEKCGGDLAYLS